MLHFTNGHQVVDHPYHMLGRIIYGEQVLKGSDYGE